MRYALNQWKALTVYLEDGELEIDNRITERASRDVAWAVEAGPSSAATRAGGRRQFCEPLSLRVNVTE